MHSNKALTSMLFQFVKLTKSILNAISHKPDDQAEWRNILQLMCHLRQALACSICGKLRLNPYTPIKEPCHCICVECREQGPQVRLNCVTCRDAFQIGCESGFVVNSNLNYTAAGFVTLCKLLIDKQIGHKWSTLQVSTPNGPLTFQELAQEGYDTEKMASAHNLGEKFRKRVKEKEHHCRCGSTAKRNLGKAPSDLTCIGQRCACYRMSKACTNCKCVGCKNPQGTSSTDQQYPLTGASSMSGPV